jgi:WD40 repeat protein
MGLVFDADAGRVVGRLAGHTGKVTAIAWHPDPASDALFTASADGSVRTWAPSGAGGGAFGTAGSLAPHGKGAPVSGLAVHPLGSHGASCCGGEGGGWALLDFSRAAVLCRVAAPLARGGGFAFHPDGVLLGAACGGGVVRIFDVRSQVVAAELGGGEGAGGGAGGAAAGGAGGGLAFSENGFYTAAGGTGGVRLFDLRKTGDASGGVVATWAMGGGASSVAFDGSGALLAAGCGDGAVAVFEVAGAAGREGGDAEAARALSTPRHHAGEVTALAWTRAAKTLASVCGTDRSLHLFRKK